MKKTIRQTPYSPAAESWSMLKLHYGYRIPDVKNRKLSIQRVGRFKIKRRVSPLAYELELPPNMKIHPVISVTNLEALPPGEDPYKRPFNDHSPPVEDDHDIDEEWKSFSIEKLLDRRLRRYGRGKKIIEYLVKWTGYGPEFNEWYGEDLLDNAVELMLEYETRQNNDPERIDYLDPQAARWREYGAPCRFHQATNKKTWPQTKNEYLSLGQPALRASPTYFYRTRRGKTLGLK
jgi:hypothetical protein